MRLSWKTLLRAGLLTVILTAVLAIPSFALSEGDWEFQIQKNEVTITGYTGSDDYIVVPSTLRGATVTNLDGIEMFHRGWGNGPVSLTIPGTIKNLDLGAHATFGWEQLTTLIIQEGVVTLKGCNIQEYPNLTNVSLPSTLKVLGDHALRGTGITSIKLPAGLTEIGNRAFEGSSIRSVDLSKTQVTKFGDACFAYCPNLSNLVLREGVKVLPDLFAASCSSLTSINFPSTVTAIGGRAFENTALKTIALPSGLKTVGAGAFQRSALVEVIVPYGVTELGYGGDAILGTFSHCDDLQAVYVPSTVKKMGFITNYSPNAIVYCAAGSFAEQTCQKLGMSYLLDTSVNTQINVLYNGQRISFGATGQNPLIENGRTLVPLRAIFETMGATVGWDPVTYTASATRGGDTIKLTLGDTVLYKNGVPVMKLDVPAKSLNGRTVVPARAVAEAFGADVDWIGSAQIVTIDE